MIRQRASAIEKGSGSRPIQRTDQLQQGRFAASARSRNGNEIALVDRKIDSAQGFDVPFVELAGKRFCLEKSVVVGSGLDHLIALVRPAAKTRRRNGERTNLLF